MCLSKYDASHGINHEIIKATKHKEICLVPFQCVIHGYVGESRDEEVVALMYLNDADELYVQLLLTSRFVGDGDWPLIRGSWR